ncbi:MAG: SAM-dependent chlorinase/fluorinase [Candidatus Zixiibacteriota bacterium]
MDDKTIITLMTDYGIADNYVGIVKGVISSLNPDAKIVDISHNLPVFNIKAASYLLETAFRAFPKGTIHLAIVDPGVGMDRKAIVVQTKDYFFVGPDNGLFSFLNVREIKRINLMANRKYFLKEVSSTFHGRDIFAPVAAYLSMGVMPDEFGSPLKSIMRPKAKAYRKTKYGISGKVLYIDHFGNLATSIRADSVPIQKSVVYFNGIRVGKIRKTFGSSEEGRPVCYVNSMGYLEIAINQGSAADYFKTDYHSKSYILIASE